MQILWLLQSQFITYCLQLVIYINELSDNIDSNTTQYADVTKLYSYICHYSILIIIKIMVKMHKTTLIKLQRGLISGSFLKCKHTYAKRKLFSIDYMRITYWTIPVKQENHVNEKDQEIWCSVNLKSSA